MARNFQFSLYASNPNVMVGSHTKRKKTITHTHAPSHNSATHKHETYNEYNFKDFNKEEEKKKKT